MILGAIAIGILTAILAGDTHDPAPGAFRSRAFSRGLHCEDLSLEEAQLRYPGRVPASRAQGDLERRVEVCAKPLLRPGLRSGRDEEVLRLARDAAADFAAAPERAALTGRTWVVDAHYPDAQVAAKLRFSTQNALMDRGFTVSDRTPLLGAAELTAVTRLSALEAYPEACRRYAANGTLRASDALLAVVHLDAQETRLHAGICADGVWSWVP
jgi:hypothetical protein